MIWRSALVAAFAATLVLPSLGQRVIVGGDEARFAILAQDMLARGTWFDARIRDQRYRNKPLLYPWVIKLLSMPGRAVTQTTDQLPIVVAAVAAVFLTTLLGQQLFSLQAGIAAGLVTATSYGFFAHSQILLPDMLVVAFGLGALCAFRAAMTDPADHRALATFYATVALGLAASGPAGLLPVPVVVIWLLTQEGLRGLRRLISRSGTIAFVVLTAVWLIPYLFAGDHSFARSVVWEDWLAWDLGGPKPLTILRMLLKGAQGLLPWTALLALPLLAVRRNWLDPAFRFVLLGWLIPVLIVALSHASTARCLLPVYPASALLIARGLDRHGTERTRAVVAIAALSVVGVLVAVVVFALPWVDPMERELVHHFWWKAGVMVSGTLALGGYVCWSLLTGRPRALVAGASLGMAALLAGGAQIYNDWVNRGQDYPGLATLVERYAQGGEVGIIGGRFLSIDFYLGRALTPIQAVSALDEWLERPDRPIVVVTGHVWSLMRQAHQDVEVLDMMRIGSHLMFLLRHGEPVPLPRAGVEPRPAPPTRTLLPAPATPRSEPAAQPEED